MVRKMGLEPTRHRHTHLKRACLPIPALPQIAFDCKKDSSTFGGIKSSPISYLFSCPIKQPLQPFLSFITVIWARKPFVGAVFARSNYRQRQISRDIAASRRGEQCSPAAIIGNARFHGSIWNAPLRRRGGFNIRPWYLAVSPNATGYYRKS